MLVSDRFTDPKSIDTLKTFFHENYPCRHCAMDDFLEDDAFQDFQPPAIIQEITSRATVQLFERILNDASYGKLIHVPKEAIVTVKQRKPSTISNQIERYGTLWRRLKLIVFLDDFDPDDGGFLELFHVEPGKHPVLRYHVPPKLNRMVLFEVHPAVYSGFSPLKPERSYRLLEVNFYTHEVPEWYMAGSVESRMERPEVD